MDKLFKNNAYGILELFIEHPQENFSARGIARKLNISHATVLSNLKHLAALQLIRKKNALYPMYYANAEEPRYRAYKKNHIVFQIIASGLAEHLQKQTLASCLVLFGSCAKGTFTEESDIDIFAEAKETKVIVASFEKKLHRKINLLYEPDLNGLSEELRNNIANGIVLYGFIKCQNFPSLRKA